MLKESAMLKVGDRAVEFSLAGNDGVVISLSQFRGKKVVLYFYPKDDTPGCTVEACSFRDVYDEILEAGAVVIGVSPDGTESHGKFRNKFNLPFYLVSDSDHQVAEAYGAWGEKSFLGKKYMGILRSTFIIDGEGMIRKVYPKVTPNGHAEEVLNALKGF